MGAISVRKTAGVEVAVDGIPLRQAVRRKARIGRIAGGWERITYYSQRTAQCGKSLGVSFIISRIMKKHLFIGILFSRAEAGFRVAYM
jgi:hypothetical protein